MTALSIPLPGLVEATVISRPNRFVAEVRLSGSGEPVLAHVADSGRLKELIFPGNQVMVRRVVTSEGGSSTPSQRKTPYDLVLASAGAGGIGTGEGSEVSPAAGPARKIWVSVDTRYPNSLLGQALRAGALQEFDSRCQVAHEYWYHHLSPWKEEDEAEAAERRRKTAGDEPATGSRSVRSRMDFYLSEGSDEASCLIEVKSVTLCRNGIGFFPDAPTDRGARHLRELTRGVSEGYRAYAVFIAQREDIEIIKPNREMDPRFADALKEARDRGVRLLGYRCTVTPTETRLDPSPIPVVLA